MKNIANLEVGENVTLHVVEGSVVARGAEGRSTAQVIGRARVTERPEGATVIETDGAVVLTLPATTSLTIRGMVEDAVLQGLQSVTMESCQGDLSAANLGALQIEEAIHGDAALRQIREACEIGTVHGDLAVRGAASLLVQDVHGDVAINQVDAVEIDELFGDLAVSSGNTLTIAHLAGDASIRKVEGAVSLEAVGGDVVVQGVGASLHLPDVAGDLLLSGEPRTGGEYHVHARGDVTVDLSGNVHLVVEAGGDIDVGETVDVVQQDEGTLEAFLGNREQAVQVRIEADGDVTINNDIRRRGRHGRFRHEHGPGRIEVEVEAEIRRAMKEARHDLRHAAHSIRSEVKRAMREADLAGQEGRAVGEVVRDTVRDLVSALRPAVPPVPPAPPEPSVHVSHPKPPPSGEELRTILRMVEEGTITPEQAEKLIQAMQG